MDGFEAKGTLRGSPGDLKNDIEKRWFQGGLIGSDGSLAGIGSEVCSRSGKFEISAHLPIDLSSIDS